MGTAQVVALPHGSRNVQRPHAQRAVARLSARLVRRSTLAVSIGVAALLVLEALAFEETYPDAASREALALWGRDPGIRILSGPATAVETVGGFVVWDAGLYLLLILSAWSLTTATRVLRGDEDAGRSDVQLASPVHATRGLLTQLLVLLGACVVVGTAVAVTLAALGAQRSGAVVFGAAVVGYCATLVGTAGVACQLLPTRGGALRVSGAVLAAWILLRMVANSGNSRTWLGWFTPPGWTDQVRSFGDNRWPVLLVPLTVSAGLVAVAVLLRRRRDTGAGILAGRESHRSRALGLGGTTAFAWRASQGVLLAWAVALAAVGAVVGVLLPTMTDYLEDDAGFRDLLAAMGMDATDLTSRASSRSGRSSSVSWSRSTPRSGWVRPARRRPPAAPSSC